jgi:tetratricopeptide (TPR) repeat protein
MHTSQRKIAWLLILLFLIPGLAYAEERARLEGRVIDPDGKPIQGVKVTATCEQDSKFHETRTTDKRGTFTIIFSVINVTYHYRFEKEGYQTLEANQNWTAEGTQRFDWTMHPGSNEVKAEAGGGGGAPVSTSPEAVNAYNAGVMAVRSKDYKTAVAKFQEAVGFDPKLTLGWIALSSAQYQQRDYKGAAASSEKAVALGSKDPGMLTLRYQAYKNLGDDEQAAAALKDLEAAGRASEEAKKLHNEGVALYKAGDNMGAIAKFKEALALDPTLTASAVGMSDAALKAGRYDDAATAAEAILKNDPNNPQALKLRYNACLELKDPNRLAEALIGLHSVDPAIAKNGLLKLAVDAYYDPNSQDHGKAWFAKLLEWDPNEAYANYYTALFLVAEGKNAEAKAHLEKVVATAPNTPQGKSAADMIKQLGSIK